MFLDESGFLLIPTRRRTWGPQGRTPVIRYSLRHERISALAALSASARRRRMGLYVRFQAQNFLAAHVADFLRALLRHLRRKVIVLWDGSPIHKGPFLRKLRHQYPRLHVEWFPGYAPELNQVEFLWAQVSEHLACRAPQSIKELKGLVHMALQRSRDSHWRLEACLRGAELPWGRRASGYLFKTQ